jgi:putative ABC transport system permease protein
MSFNPALAWRLAWRRLIHHQMITAATILGVTLGMVVIGAILIVDANSNEQPRFGESLTEFPGGSIPSPGSSWNERDHSSVTRIYFERGPITKAPAFSGFPSQKGEARSGFSAHSPPQRRGEQDYQAMRLAVRLAAMLAFAVVIVFYTMRFATLSRAREFSLLLCLGEERRNVALSLFLETLLLGTTGTLLGLLLAFPVAAALIGAGISTTGRVPSETFTVPWVELSAIGALSIVTALLGVLGPIRTFYRMQIADTLQPRILSEEMDQHALQLQGFAWLLPPLVAVGWIVARPFIRRWSISSWWNPCSY